MCVSEFMSVYEITAASQGSLSLSVCLSQTLRDIIHLIYLEENKIGKKAIGKCVWWWFHGWWPPVGFSATAVGEIMMKGAQNEVTHLVSIILWTDHEQRHPHTPRPHVVWFSPAIRTCHSAQSLYMSQPPQVFAIHISASMTCYQIDSTVACGTTEKTYKQYIIPCMNPHAFVEFLLPLMQLTSSWASALQISNERFVRKANNQSAKKSKRHGKDTICTYSHPEQ